MSTFEKCFGATRLSLITTFYWQKNQFIFKPNPILHESDKTRAFAKIELDLNFYLKEFFPSEKRHSRFLISFTANDDDVDDDDDIVFKVKQTIYHASQKKSLPCSVWSMEWSCSVTR